MGKDKRRLAQNRAKKKAREAARKKQKKQRAGGGRFAHLGCTRAELERSPIHAAYVGEKIETFGLGYVILARKLPDGRVAAGIFQIDAYCLGVKDAVLAIFEPPDFDSTIEERFRAAALQPVSPPYARKLIEDAIAYARDLGFEPHRDFRDASVVLGDVNPAACTETFTFGKDGKPLYVSGPYDSPIQIRRIMAQLRRRLGPDGAHFMIESDDPDLLEKRGEDGATLDDDDEDWEEEVEEDGDEDEEGEEDEEGDTEDDAALEEEDEDEVETPR